MENESPWSPPLNAPFYTAVHRQPLRLPSVVETLDHRHVASVGLLLAPWSSGVGGRGAGLGGAKRLPRKIQGSVGNMGGPGGLQRESCHMTHLELISERTWSLQVAQQGPWPKPFPAGWG